METEIQETIQTENSCESKKKCKCTCKCLPYAIMGVLAIAIIVLYILFFIPKCSKPAVEEVVIPIENQLPIAFVNMDSLLAKYNLYSQMQDELIAQQERARATVNQKANALQADAQDFQNKLENRAFLSEERARSEQERILRKQQELEQLDARLSQELVARQAQMMDSLTTLIRAAVKEYNADKQYHYIISNTSNAVLLYGNPGYDITNDIVNILNASESEEK